MTKIGKFKLIVGTVLRALLGLPTQDKYEEKTNSPRPILYSRRVINGSAFAASSLLAAIIGINIPPEAITAFMDAGSNLYNVAIENKPAVAAFWTALMTIVGHLKRKK